MSSPTASPRRTRTTAASPTRSPKGGAPGARAAALLRRLPRGWLARGSARGWAGPPRLRRALGGAWALNRAGGRAREAAKVVEIMGGLFPGLEPVEIELSDLRVAVAWLGEADP